jgi:hypothetical protein
MSQLRTLQQVMVLFCERFVSWVVGKCEWNKKKFNTKQSELTTASDEAFTLLVLENIWEPWQKLAESTDSLNRELDENGNFKKRNPVSGKFTKNACGARRYCGWDAYGITRFNNLLLQVHKDRQENGAAFDEYFVNVVNEERKKFHKPVTNVAMPVEPMDELSDDE